jgi:hypothetical protein
LSGNFSRARAKIHHEGTKKRTGQLKRLNHGEHGEHGGEQDLTKCERSLQQENARLPWMLFTRHSGESIVRGARTRHWIPAFAGMTAAGRSRRGCGAPFFARHSGESRNPVVLRRETKTPDPGIRRDDGAFCQIAKSPPLVIPAKAGIQW